MWTRYFLLSLCLIFINVNVNGGVIHSRLLRTLSTQGTANIMVRMKEGTEKVLNNIPLLESSTLSRGEYIEEFTNALEENARESQKNVWNLLNNNIMINSNVKSESLWITNSIYIKNADQSLIEELNALEEVGLIEEERIIELETPSIEMNTMNTSSLEWGLNMIKTSEAWDFGKTKGKGIVVANIDTGVLGTHESLKGNYRGGKYSWFDPYDKSSSPIDKNGHGTHTMGTIAGSGGIGVAPEAKWIACRGCGTRSCSEYALTKCGEFMTCPTDVTGNNKNCDAAPNLVSNSWGGRQNDPWYKKITSAWHKAKIIPIFAMGNSGPYCGTANSPGDQLDVIAVGATASDDSLARFSSVGPRKGGGDRVKPDIAAPGHRVRSAWNNGDSSYVTISGTSMATPHVSGVVALMMAYEKDLKYEKIFKILTSTTDKKSLKLPGKNCGGIDESKFPNQMVGHGRVNALSVLKALKPTKPTAKPTPKPTLCKLVFKNDFPTCVPENRCMLKSLFPAKCGPIFGDWKWDF